MTSPDSAGEERAFDELWEAQTFAIAVALHERGLFAWSEWTAKVAAEDYSYWLTALEGLVEDNIADRPTLLHYREAWRRAAARTPHGLPVELQKGDFA